MSEDELDFVMYYIREGLWFEGKGFGRDRMCEVSIYTENWMTTILPSNEVGKLRSRIRRCRTTSDNLLHGLECHPEGDAIDAILCIARLRWDARRLLANNIGGYRGSP